MFSPETLREGAAKFDGYAIAMSALVAPNEFLLFDESRTPYERLIIVKGIAVASLQEVVTISGQQASQTEELPSFFLDVADTYYCSELADRIAEPVRLMRPNPLLSTPLRNKLKKRKGRISVIDLTAGLPLHSSYDKAVEGDVLATRNQS